MIDFYKNRKIEIWVLGLFTFVFLVIDFIYVFSNSVFVYDAAAHLGAIEQIKNHFLPFFSGWNPNSLLGFDQGVLYPPLFHWLAAVLALGVGTVISVKILVSLALIALPASVYFWASSFKAKRQTTFLITLVVVLIILTLPGYLGADLKALTKIGLLPDFISTPFVFLFLGSLNRIKKWGYLPVSLLWTILILTHLVAGIFAFICLLAYFLVDSFKDKQISWRFYGRLFLISAVLTSFFWIPFLLQSSFLSVSVHSQSLLLPGLAGLILGGLFVQIFWKQDRQLLSLALVVVILSFLSIIDNLNSRVLTGGPIFDKIYSLHLYRYQIYNFVLVGVSLVLSLRNKLTLSFRLNNYHLLGLLIIYFSASYLIVNQAFLNLGAVKFLPNLPKIEGRFLEIFNSSESYPHNYSLQNKLATDKNLPWAYGLFTDASPNGPYLGSLKKSLRPAAYGQLDQRFIENRQVDKDRQADYLDLFALTNVIYLDNQPSGCLPIASATIDGKEKIYHLQSRSLVSLVGVPTQTLTVKSEDWDQEVEKWWFGKGRLGELLFFEEGGITRVPSFKQRSGASAEVIEHNQNWTNFKIKAKADQPVPVLVKFGYSPNWTAYQNGQQLKIYRTSPNLMVVFAKGEVSFKYRRLWYQDLSLLISLGGLVIIGWLIKKQLHGKANKTSRT